MSCQIAILMLQWKQAPQLGTPGSGSQTVSKVGWHTNTYTCVALVDTSSMHGIGCGKYLYTPNILKYTSEGNSKWFDSCRKFRSINTASLWWVAKHMLTQYRILQLNWSLFGYALGQSWNCHQWTQEEWLERWFR